MFRNFLASGPLTLLLAGFPTFLAADPDDSAAALTGDFVRELREGYEMGPADRARSNALANTDLRQLALNRRVVRGEDGHFSHKIKTKGITDQKASGRCWMFAGFNVLRPEIIRERGLDDFAFSSAYLQFWDKLEKANLYFEQVIELRDADRLDREWQVINEWMVSDGGWWNYATSLMEKYGVVPATAMPETHASENTKSMNRVLERLLHSRAAELLAAHEDGTDVAGLRKLKKRALGDVYRFLVLNLGEPPTEFEWRYEFREKSGEGKDPDGEPARLTELKPYTPQSFYREFVGVDLSRFVSLYHDPAQPLNRHYRFKRARNIAGRPAMSFVNIDIGEMKEIAVKSVLANQPMWFAVNMRVDQSREHGLMELGLYDYEALFGLEMLFTKADRSRFHAGASNHAMVLTGVDLRDGRPHKWLVENSWGKEDGREGTWTLYDRWFDEHVYTIVVHRDHVPAETLAFFDEAPVDLPAWYPGAAGIPAE